MFYLSFNEIALLQITLWTFKPIVVILFLWGYLVVRRYESFKPCLIWVIGSILLILVLKNSLSTTIALWLTVLLFIDQLKIGALTRQINIVKKNSLQMMLLEVLIPLNCLVCMNSKPFLCSLSLHFLLYSALYRIQ